MKRKPAPCTQAELRGLLDYDPETGVLSWRTSGKRAGRVLPSGYRQVTIKASRYYSHRLIWFWVTGCWPELEVDHRDADNTNDRFENLRAATPTQNQGNKKLNRNNTSGFKGVTFHKRRGLYMAQIKIGGKNKCLGYFGKPEDAHAAYLVAAFGHFEDFVNPG